MSFITCTGAVVRGPSVTLHKVTAIPAAAWRKRSLGGPFDPHAEMELRVRSAIIETRGDAGVPPFELKIDPPAPATASLDLAGFVAALALIDNVPEQDPGILFMGELALNGAIRPVRGTIAAAIAGQAAGFKLIATANAEAKLGPLDVLWWRNVRELPFFTVPDPEIHGGPCVSVDELRPPLRELVGTLPPRALLLGPPGCGRTMLARRINCTRPPLEGAELLEVQTIHDAAGLALTDARPFRAPHHTCSEVALAGDASRYGEINLARRGVLFLDELPEFRRAVLEGLATRLDQAPDARIIAAANLCPCGQTGRPSRHGQCKCPDAARGQWDRMIESYRKMLGLEVVRLPAP